MKCGTSRVNALLSKRPDEVKPDLRHLHEPEDWRRLSGRSTGGSGSRLVGHGANNYGDASVSHTIWHFAEAQLPVAAVVFACLISNPMKILPYFFFLGAAFLPGLAAMAEDPVPQWIWSQATGGEKEVALFRREFQVKQCDIARLTMTADDQAVVFVNGKQVAECKGWENIQVVDVSAAMQKGRNFIAVQGRNGRAGSAGVLAQLVLETRKERQVIVSDAAWKVGAKEEAGWNSDAKFDVSGWKNAVVIAALGQGPWGAKVNASALAAAAHLNQPEATPVKDIRIKEGFKVELLYSVPMEKQGSWVATCFDDKGRLIVSDQYGKLYRVTLPPLDGSPSETKVEDIPVDFGECQGLLYAFGSLYGITNSDKYPRGLWRISDTNKDDMFDKVEQLRAFPNQGGEHGPHAVLLGPDGKSLYCRAWATRRRCHRWTARACRRTGRRTTCCRRSSAAASCAT